MTPAGDIEAFMGPERRLSAPFELGSAQHGVVSRSQLVWAGWSARQIKTAISSRRLTVLHRGVYAVGHVALEFEGRLTAAVLAGGEGAAVSHLSAARLWGIGPMPQRVEISVPRTRRFNPDTVVVHRPHRLIDDIVIRNGIAVTTVPRTLMDLAPRCSIQELRRMLNESEYQRLADRTLVADRLARTPSVHGARKLKRVLATNAPPSRGELERRFHQLIARSGLPAPRRNSIVEIRGERFEVDAWWPEHRLVVELDGAKAHNTDNRFELDRRRDELFVAEGIRVVRITWKRVTTDSVDLVRSMNALLVRTGDIEAA